MSILRYINQNATRNQPLVPGLAGNLERAVADVFGPGAYLQVYSGGQPGKGEGGARTGSIRHDHGRAADIRVFGADGNQISGDALAPLGQYWRANNLGGVGLEMHGGGIHLDDWVKPPPGGGMNWNYASQNGRYTDAQASAIAAGNKGILPTLFDGQQMASSPTMTSGASDAPQSTGDAPNMAYNAQPNPSPACAAIDQQTTGSTMPTSLPASLPSDEVEKKKGGLLGGILDFNNPQTLIALQLIMNGMKSPDHGFDGIPELALYKSKTEEADRLKRQETLQRNQTYQFMLKNSPEIAQAMIGGMPVADAYSIWSKTWAQKNDPKAQAELQKLNLEIGNLQNPRSPDAVRTLQDRARLAGLREGTPEYQQFILNNGARPDTYRQLSADEIKTHGLDPKKSYQVGADNKISAIGDAGVNITNNLGEGDSFYKRLDEKNAESFVTIGDTGRNARARAGQIDRLENLFGRIPQGIEGGFKKLAGDYGISLGPETGDIQAATALIEKMVPEQRAPGSGSMSDQDIAMFRASLPRLLNQPGGNQLIFQTLRGIAQYEQQAGAIADSVANREISPAKGRQLLQSLRNPLSDFGPTVSGNDARTPTPSSSQAMDADTEALIEHYKNRR